MEQLSASYTLLKAWEDGRYEDAVNGYFRLKPLYTKATEEGNRYHEMWQQEVDTFKRVPQIFCKDPVTGLITDMKLNAPRTELRLEFEVADWLKLTGRIDCDDPVDNLGITYDLFEWKTGVTDAPDYLGTRQPTLYGFIGHLMGIKYRKVSIGHYNQHDRYATWAMGWITDSMIRETGEWAITTAEKIHKYFTENGLWKYNANRLEAKSRER